LIGQAQVFDRGTGRRAATGDVDGAGAAVGGVKFPDLKVALENYGAPVVTNAGPEHTAVFELGYRSGLAADVFGPDVLSAAAIGNVINRAVVLAPHRPDLFGTAFAELLKAGLRAEAHQPDLPLIDVTMTFAPPLPTAKSMAGKSHAAAIAFRRAEIFKGVLIGRNLHRRAAVAADPEDVRAAVVAAAGTKINPASISRPGVQLIVTVVEGQPLQIAGVDREDVDVAVTCAR